MPDKPFFVMLTTQSGGSTPMEEVDLVDLSVAFYETEEEAIQNAKTTLYGANHGFEVFELGGGTHHG